ncbi:MAG: zinc finger Ran-binding domain-containing protein [Candidatus Thorarchaeota archaeon]|jgi:predicted  nucleic acid-binding Zn-ribbon protein
MMRNCEKCGKANQPTRKYCIRCGSSLLKTVKKAAPAPQPTIAQPAPPPTAPAPAPPVAETPSAATSHASVKPSEVSKDRVRSGGGIEKPKSEMEKARAAFAKAETVGIEEAEGGGIIETRMLRASEVKELLEGPGMMAGGEDIPAPTMMEGSEPLPPEAADMMPQSGPSATQIEESILGAKSAYVDQTAELKPETTPDTAVSPSLSAEFSTSSRYGAEGDAPVLEAVTVEEPSAPASDTGFASVAPSPETTKAEPSLPKVDSDLDQVIACPDCGKVINVDMFEYPSEVYSKMGAARLNQARISIVQNKNDEAMKAVRMARAMYEKADDTKGLKEVLKLVESLAKSG